MELRLINGTYQLFHRSSVESMTSEARPLEPLTPKEYQTIRRLMYQNDPTCPWCGRVAVLQAQRLNVENTTGKFVGEYFRSNGVHCKQCRNMVVQSKLPTGLVVFGKWVEAAKKKKAVAPPVTAGILDGFRRVNTTTGMQWTQAFDPLTNTRTNNIPVDPPRPLLQPDETYGDYVIRMRNEQIAAETAAIQRREARAAIQQLRNEFALRLRPTFTLDEDGF